MMRIGYARVARKDQKLEPQRDALLADGCERVFEKVSSREVERVLCGRPSTGVGRGTSWCWQGWIG